jgi:23S rRNA (cytosine1962-C5)-methyltransferase
LNLEGHVQVHRHEGDVLNCLDRFRLESFDIIIADPPGFIKAKKDLESGKSAYIRLNTEALKLAAPASLYFSCSCSGLLTEDEFSEVVSKSFLRSGKQGRWVIQGGPSFDHPALVGFSQSRYLKMFGFVIKGSAQEESAGS